MTRILARLGVANLAFLLAALGLGLLSQARHGLERPDADSTYLVHFCAGLFAVIFNLALHCLVFIYLLGTGRWVKEVALAYQLPDAPLPKETRELKRQTFPPALLAMLVPIAAAAAGMGRQWREWHWTVHLTLAVLSVLVNVWALRLEYRNVARNAGVIDEVMREVERIRSARGLPTNEEAWRQQQAGGAG